MFHFDTSKCYNVTPVGLEYNGEKMYFQSQSECSRYLAGIYGRKPEYFRQMLAKGRTYCRDYKVLREVLK